MLKIGSHVSLKSPQMYLGSVKEALSYNSNSFMVYTGAPQNTFRKNLDEMKIEEALDLIKIKNIDVKNIIVHAPYIINLANPDLEKRKFAVEFLSKEIIRTEKLLASQIVLHPGNAVGKDKKQAIRWIAEGINQVLKNTNKSNVKIALETMAGKGSEIGRNFDELKEIIELIDNKDRISICLDTCHIHDAGYDVRNFDEVLREFDLKIGIEKIGVIHINDSKNPKGAMKDRHENIGFGYIGFDALIKVIYHEKFKDIPKILETPYVENYPPYKHEIEMILRKEFNENLKEIIIAENNK